MSYKKLYRVKEGRVLAGVCNGIGEYFDIDPIVFRLLFLVGFFSAFPAFLTYVILWMLMPKK